MTECLTFSLSEVFEVFVLVTFALMLCVVVPVQLAAKCRRIRHSKVRIICRVCGYRFLRKDPQAICPHCDARNR